MLNLSPKRIWLTISARCEGAALRAMYVFVQMKSSIPL
jgi:hypothetical protein